MVTGPSPASLVTAQPEVGRRFAFLLPRHAGQLAGGVLVVSVQPTLSLSPLRLVVQPPLDPGPLPCCLLRSSCPGHAPLTIPQDLLEALLED